MGIAELRRSVEAPSDSREVRSIPLLERNDRQKTQQARLSGVETEVGLQKLLEAFKAYEAFKGLLKPAWL